jgi:hypothetical protein
MKGVGRKSSVWLYRGARNVKVERFVLSPAVHLWFPFDPQLHNYHMT